MSRLPLVGRVARLRYALVGLWPATVLALLSFTPSLLPRGWAYQGLVAGASAAFGYLVGVTAAAVVRELLDRDPGPTRARSWRGYLVVLAVGGLAALVAGIVWNRQSSALVGMEPVHPAAALLLTPVVAAVVFVALVGARPRPARPLPAYGGVAGGAHQPPCGPGARGSVPWWR